MIWKKKRENTYFVITLTGWLGACAPDATQSEGCWGKHLKEREIRYQWRYKHKDRGEGTQHLQWMSGPPAPSSHPPVMPAGPSVFVGCGCKRIFVHSSCFEMKRNFPDFYEWNPGLCHRELYGQGSDILSEDSSRWWTEITKLDNFKNFNLEAFCVLTIDKVKAQKWPILLILLPGRYWVRV